MVKLWKDDPRRRPAFVTDVQAVTLKRYLCWKRYFVSRFRAVLAGIRFPADTLRSKSDAVSVLSPAGSTYLREVLEYASASHNEVFPLVDAHRRRQVKQCSYIYDISKWIFHSKCVQFLSKHWWFSGKIGRCHLWIRSRTTTYRPAPGSIPGRCMHPMVFVTKGSTWPSFCCRGHCPGRAASCADALAVCIEDRKG